MPRLTRAVLVTLLVAGSGAVGAAPAAAAPADPPPADGMVRLMHLSPDTPSVDAYIDPVSTPGTRVVLPAVSYGDVSGYQPVPAGTYTVSARGAGADPGSPPALTTALVVEPGGAVTIAAVGSFAELRLAVLADDLSLPPAGQARARVVNAAATASPLDLSVAGAAPLATGLEFGAETGYADVPGGPGTLQVTAAGTSADVPVDLATGSVHTVVVLDRDGGGVDVETALDAASPGVVPAGGVETGAGGTAAERADGGGRTAAGLAVLLVPAAVGAVLLRRPARGRAPRRAS